MPKQNVHALEIDFNVIDQIQMNGEIYDSIVTSKEAKRLLDEYEDILVKKREVDFELDTWIFISVLTNINVYINFEQFKNVVRFIKEVDAEDLIIALKCWVVFRLQDHSVETVSYKLNKIFQTIVMTRAFSLDAQLEYFENINNRTIEGESVSDIVMNVHVGSAISFLSFYEMNDSNEYIAQLLELRDKLVPEESNRILPSSTDSITFSKAINLWYEELITGTSFNPVQLLKYYPIVLWWNFSSIIPIRPSEFCHIKRKCLSVDGYSITFPRFKKHRKGLYRKEITYDKLPVPEKIYKMFEHYIELTEEYGQTEFLIHFKAFVQTIRISKFSQKNYSNEDYFTNQYLGELIAKFYKEIISEKYGFAVNVTGRQYINAVGMTELRPDNPCGHIERMLRPGDSRQIAIITMMMQGYDRVEIARLAGHIHFETQYHYQNQIKFWTDSEIQRLTQEFMLRNLDGYVHPKAYKFIDDQIEKCYFDKDILEDSIIQLDLGYCKDETMPCPTFNWHYTGCYFCKHWGISIEQLLNNRSTILEELNGLYNDLMRKINFLVGLFNIHSLDETGNINPDLKSNLRISAIEIKRDIFSIAKLKYLLGVEGAIDEKICGKTQ